MNNDNEDNDVNNNDNVDNIVSNNDNNRKKNKAINDNSNDNDYQCYLSSSLSL